MIKEIVDLIKTRLKTISGLDVETEQKQVLESALPVCFIDLNSVKPASDEYFPKYHQKCKAQANFFLTVYHSSTNSLLDLVESIELALDVTVPLSGTLDFQYSGFDIAAKEAGKKIVASQLSFSVQYIKQF